MARVSKRIAARAAISVERQVSHYKAGIYARLSSNQDKAKNESVEMQVKIAEKYIEDINEKQMEQIEIIDRYIDLGKTGSNFRRDEFGRLMQDIRLGEINCVVVKDLSRFGRNYLEAGNYIEKIFPFLGVRFIAVCDRFDTGMDGNEKKQMVVEIKNLINDMYTKEASVKRKQSLRQCRQAGGYVGGPAPYGYVTEYEKKVRKLKPDEKTADIVRYIFERFIETTSCSAVADDLNGRRINSPTIYRQTGEVFFSERERENYRGWDRSAVERIVNSETYTGRLVQGKTSITARDENNRIHKPEGEWCIKENAHEPLIDVRMFGQAKEIMQKIAQAEEQAASIREQAGARARGIAAQAEADAAAMKKTAAVKAKNLRENGVRVAQEQADADYRRALEKSAEDARVYADEFAGKTDSVVKEIVRRISLGR